MVNDFMKKQYLIPATKVTSLELTATLLVGSPVRGTDKRNDIETDDQW